MIPRINLDAGDRVSPSATASGGLSRGDVGKPKKKLQRNDRSNRNTRAYVLIDHIVSHSCLLRDCRWTPRLLRLASNFGWNGRRNVYEHFNQLEEMIDHICLTRACSETAGRPPGTW
ncbi:uncharacterized protein LOC131167350 isoform X2 [Malania oleifera]|uniref:uncharacterized protein LOC131167350 isoform X2 n=1 Tax=Malania oleifera TaxID=397392 RepID=UPI0025ADC72D|nr:uncharacterized protein LOC131167350 isoform X2 [Malania oleifera]